MQKAISCTTMDFNFSNFLKSIISSISDLDTPQSEIDFMSSLKLLELGKMLKVKVFSRPSKEIRSPYMADIIVNGQKSLAHCPSLSCCNIISAGKEVWVEEREKKEKSTAKSNYTVQLGISESGSLIGVNPTFGNQIALQILKKKVIDLGFQYQDADIHRQVTYGDSRFDFQISNDSHHVIQVKYVPIALHEDVDFLKYDSSKYKGIDSKEKIAIFPVGEKGVQVLKGEPVSPRAVKHLQQMGRLLTTGKISSATLLFVIMRDDIAKFKISDNDLKYKQAIKQAMKSGVKMRALSVRWTNNTAYFDRQLDVIV